MYYIYLVVSNIVTFSILFNILVTSGKSTRIIGSVYAEITDFIFHAALRRISDNVVVCSGAIITDSHILTAAHCVNKPIVSHVNLKIITGTSNITAFGGQVHHPKKIFVHPGFTGDIGIFSTVHNDVAVIQVCR
jgi:secreted trypsin-like serine protease